MKLTELYHKYINSGILGNPVITDAELAELRLKLEELEEFFHNYNPLVGSVARTCESVDRMIAARKET